MLELGKKHMVNEYLMEGRRFVVPDRFETEEGRRQMKQLWRETVGEFKRVGVKVEEQLVWARMRLREVSKGDMDGVVARLNCSSWV